MTESTYEIVDLSPVIEDMTFVGCLGVIAVAVDAAVAAKPAPSPAVEVKP